MKTTITTNPITAKTLRLVGFHLAFGAIAAVGFALTLGLLFALACNALTLFTDDSDISGWNRSGLIVHTDAKTGVQYLSTPRGAITPRLDREGRIIVIKR